MTRSFFIAQGIWLQLMSVKAFDDYPCLKPFAPSVRPAIVHLLGVNPRTIGELTERETPELYIQLTDL